jgi:glycosyltransferase involved in cell wall biosynthesis
MVIPVMQELSKVAHVMRRFTPDKWGGTESVVSNVSKELMRREIDSPVFCTDMLSQPGSDIHEGIAIHRFRYIFPWFGLSDGAKKKLVLKGGSPLSLSLFFALLCEKKVSVIHTHVQHRLGGVARTVAMLRRIPYVVSLHGGFYTVPQEQIDRMSEPFLGKLEWGKVFGALFGSRRVLTDSDAIICVGKSEYDEVRQRFPFKHVFCVPNGVDVEKFARADGGAFRKAYGFQPSEKIVLCVSRIDYQKNQLGLVRAFAEFHTKHPDHRLVLVGAVTVEDYLAEIMAEVERLGLTTLVTVIEGLRPDDPLLPSAYRAAEMFVLPSMHEPFGIVVLEAWAAGIPVVASRVGGIPGFATDQENILMIEPGNEDELVSRMADLSDDVVLRSDLSRKAFGEVAANYDWAKIGARFQEIYALVMKK